LFQYEQTIDDFDGVSLPRISDNSDPTLTLFGDTDSKDYPRPPFTSFSLSFSIILPASLPTPGTSQSPISPSPNNNSSYQEAKHRDTSQRSRYSTKHFRFIEPDPYPSRRHITSPKATKRQSVTLSPEEVGKFSIHLIQYLHNEEAEAPYEILANTLQQTEDGWKCPLPLCDHKPYKSKSSAVTHVRRHIGNRCYRCEFWYVQSIAMLRTLLTITFSNYRTYQNDDVRKHRIKHHATQTGPPPLPSNSSTTPY
jgi:hypothetical protein